MSYKVKGIAESVNTANKLAEVNINHTAKYKMEKS